jgi:DNA-binding NarL/FixJ family response regulator
VKTQIIKYLLIEHLLLLQEGFHYGISMLAKKNPHITIQGKEINTQEGYGNFIVSLKDAEGVEFIWMNIDFPFSEQEKRFPSALLDTLKRYNPEVQILVVLQHATVYTLRNIFQKIKPHGILELKDCDQKTIYTALKASIQKEIFYSKSILQLLHTFLQTFESMDHADFAILHELDLGTAVSALPEKVFLSHATILTRRANLKALFKLEGKTDSQLLQEVKRLGYV